MKTSKFFAGLIVLFTTFSFISCTPDQDFTPTTKEIISQGTWSVDYFYAGQDNTAQYTSYHFNFTGNGAVTVSTASGEASGTWALMIDVNRKEVIQINIQTQEPVLQAVNEIWNISDQSSHVIALTGTNSTQLRLKKM